MTDVTLRTKKGWKLVVKRDDPVFSDVLAPILEFDDPVSELILESSVADIFEREYKAASKVIELTNEMNESGIGHLRDDGGKWPDIARKARIHLDQISHIVRILNMPTNWQVFVGVMPGDPDFLQHIDSLSHVELIGGYPSVSRYHEGDGAIVWRCHRVGSMLSPEIGSHLPRPEVGTEDALVYNLFIADYTAPDNILDFNWEEALACLKRANPELSAEKENCLLTCAGKGDNDQGVDMPREYLDIKVTKKNELSRGIARLIIKYDRPVNVWYTYAVATYPQDIDPMDFGLNYLISPKTIKKTYVEGTKTVAHRPVNKFSTIAVWVHQNLSLIAYHNGAEGENQQATLFAEYAEKYIMGRQGLARVLISLIYAIDMQTNEKKKVRLNFLANAIEKHLKKGLHASPLNKYPAYELR